MRRREVRKDEAGENDVIREREIGTDETGETGATRRREVRSDETAVTRSRRVEPDETGLMAARRRFGGLDLPAALAGMLAALGLTMVLGAAAAAVLAMRYDDGVARNTLWNGGGITAAAVVALSLIVGGWVAARIARYDGIANAWLCAVTYVAVLGGAVALGNWADGRWDLLQDVDAPQWLSDPTRSGATAMGLVAIGVVLVASAFGGMLGAAYHRRADAVIATGPAVVDGDADVDVERADYSARHAVR